MNGDQFAAIERAVQDILEAIGENPMREGLRETPARVARFWKEFAEWQAGNTDTAFEAEQTDQLVIVRAIPAWSMCEHHLLPFRMSVAVGYLTNVRVIGLSKIPRIVQRHAHRLQMQERFAASVAREVLTVTQSDGVGVLVAGEHTCMAMRGVRSAGQMVNSVLLGSMHDPALRAEFLSLARSNEHFG